MQLGLWGVALAQEPDEGARKDEGAKTKTTITIKTETDDGTVTETTTADAYGCVEDCCPPTPIKSVFIGVSSLAALLVFGFLISQFTERRAITNNGNALTGRYMGYSAGILLAGLTFFGTYRYATGCTTLAAWVITGVFLFFFLLMFGYALTSKDA